MNNTPGISVKHTLAISSVLVVGGLFVWIVQLARQGEPVGYIMLTGIGLLAALLVTGLVLYMLITAIGKNNHAAMRPTLKSIYDTQRVMDQQNRTLLNQLKQAQQNPAFLPAGPQVELGPGQMMTQTGFVIDGTAFEALDDE